MNDKKIRYVATIFTLDRIYQSLGITSWDKESFFNFVKEQEKKYGLKLISSKEEILIIVEYTNIIWNYKIYYGTYKNKYKSITANDERWTKIEKQLEIDLKIIGLNELKNAVLTSLQNQKYFEYKIKIEKQFKKYCV